MSLANGIAEPQRSCSILPSRTRGSKPFFPFAGQKIYGQPSSLPAPARSRLSEGVSHAPVRRIAFADIQHRLPSLIPPSSPRHAPSCSTSSASHTRVFHRPLRRRPKSHVLELNVPFYQTLKVSSLGPSPELRQDTKRVRLAPRRTTSPPSCI
jgi:hypothetical protein